MKIVLAAQSPVRAIGRPYIEALKTNRYDVGQQTGYEQKSEAKGNIEAFDNSFQYHSLILC